MASWQSWARRAGPAWVVVVLLGSACATPSAAKPAVLPATPSAPPSGFAAAWAEEEARPEDAPEPPGSPLEALRARQVLFVGGFLNEVISGYFDDNAAVVKAFGATAWMLSPPSTSSLGADADFIALKARDHYEGSHRPVVLFGHSKGGAASLMAVLRHPELVLLGVVDCVVVVQGAVGGSPVADLAATPLHAAGLPAPLAGLDSLQPGDARPAFVAALAHARATLSPAEFGHLSSRIFYVRSVAQKDHLSPVLGPTHGLLCERGSGQSDGLVLAEDARLDGCGVDLGVVPGDHAALTVSGPLSNATPHQRRAFTRALFREVYGARLAGRPVDP